MDKTFCSFCGAKLTTRKIENRLRLFCTACRIPIYENPIPATACVVFNQSGNLLLVKRAKAPHKGRWCLHGGFLETDETAEQGCLRELQEETGLTGLIDKELGIYQSKSTIHRSVIVIGFSVKANVGKICPGDDAQEVCFFPLSDKPALAFKAHERILAQALKHKEHQKKKKEADKLIRKSLLPKQIGAYVITSGDHIELTSQACQAGTRLVQYRDKTATVKTFLSNAQRIREITSAYDCLFIVNDFLDIALLVNADGVHLGQDDLPINQARMLTPPGFIIGCSTHSFEQALNAEKQGADYIGIGPVFATPTKKDYIPVGLDLAAQVSVSVKIPVVAIGGINLTNIDPLIQAGIKNVAMVRQYQKNTGDVVKKVNRLFGL